MDNPVLKAEQDAQVKKLSMTLILMYIPCQILLLVCIMLFMPFQFFGVQFQIGKGSRGDVTILPTLVINNRQYRGLWLYL